DTQYLRLRRNASEGFRLQVHIDIPSLFLIRQELGRLAHEFRTYAKAGEVALGFEALNNFLHFDRTKRRGWLVAGAILRWRGYTHVGEGKASPRSEVQE